MSEELEIQTVRIWQLIKGREYYVPSLDATVTPAESPQALLPFESDEAEGYEVIVTGGKGFKPRKLTDFGSRPADQQIEFIPL